MRALLLPPRYTPDTDAIWHAALAAGWGTERVHGWRVRPVVSSYPSTDREQLPPRSMSVLPTLSHVSFQDGEATA